MNNIKSLRKSLGLTQKELAKMVNVDQSAISYWERGTNRPVRKYVPVLAQALGVTVTELGLNQEDRP